MPGLAELLRDGLGGSYRDAVPFVRAFARVLPTATLVPALAVRGTPPTLRMAIALGLAAPIAFAFPAPSGSLPLTLVSDVIAGIPFAIVFATPLWMAAHVGAIADVLRGAPEANIAPPPATDGARGPLATLAALLAASAWIASGGATRALLVLSASAPANAAPWALAARSLADGLRLSIALSAGVLVAAVALEAALIAIGRAALPIPVQPIATLARPLVALLALSASLQLAVTILVR